MDKNNLTPSPVVIQDGGQFYDEDTGYLVADFGRVTDGDVKAAKQALSRFRLEFPEYLVRT